jgi:hypothetical protein
MAGMRYQPQGLARLNPSSKLARAAQAIVLGSAPINLASGKALTTAGTGVAKLATPAGVADSFRKNFYRTTELLPPIGTQTFVEFWVGYPSSDLYSKGNGDVGFLTGSSNNSTGIASSLGTKEIVVGSYAGTDWGAVYNWGTLNTAGEALVPGKLTCLVVVRRQDRTEFWRDGVLVRAALQQSPTNYGASKFIVGGFIEELSYWPASSDMLLAGRAIVDLSPDEVRAFSANPWSLFADPYEDDEIVPSTSAPAGVTGTLNAALGSVSLASTGAAKASCAAAIGLGALTAAAAATVAEAGALSSTLAALALNAACTVSAAGTLTATLAPATLSAAGTASTGGALSATLGSVTLVAAAVAPASGALTRTLGALSLAAAGTAGTQQGGQPTPASGQMAAQLGAITLAATGTMPVTGQANVTLGGLVASAAGSAPDSGRLNATLGALSVAAYGGVPVMGGLQAALGELTLAATAGMFVFTRSAARTYVIQPESRRYQIAPENRTYRIEP